MKLFEQIKKIDLFSKFLLLLIIFVFVYLVYFYTKDFTQNRSRDELIEVSTHKSISLNDYFFEHYQQNRLANDSKLFIKINEDISPEQLDKLEFRIIPKQEIEKSLISSNLIEVRFKNSSPADLKENVLIILESGKQLFRVTYKNLSPDDSKADEIFYKRTE